jgi:hypothetical protein
MSGRWSFYRADTGEFTGRVFVGLERTLALNIPAGCKALLGSFDPRSQRVDLATGQVVAYQRPAAEIEAEQRAVRARSARQRIASLELAQLRPIRELAIDPENAEAKRRLEAIDGEIAALRAEITR